MKLRVIGRGLRERRLDFKQLAIETRAGAPTERSRAIHFARGADGRRDGGRAALRPFRRRPAAGPWSSRSSTPPLWFRPDASVHRDAMGNIVLDLEAAP